MVELMRARLAFLLLLGLTLGCGDDSSPTSPSRPQPVPGLTITCPANVSVTTTATSGQIAYSAPAVSGGTVPVTVACTPASGATFPLGTTTVSCAASDARQQQATCGFQVTLTRIPTLQRTSYLAFGDSITAGEVTSPVGTAMDERGFPFFRLVVVPSASYPVQLQTLLRNRYVTQASSITVTNSGVPGEFAVDSARRFTQVYTQTRPEVVLILDGYNDLNTLGSAAIASAAAAVESMARQARQGGSRVYIANLTPPRTGGLNAIPVATITAYNDRMRAIAAGEGAAFVDLYSALVGNIPLYIGVDGLHPTEVGYQKMAEAFFEAIQRTLENR